MLNTKEKQRTASGQTLRALRRLARKRINHLDSVRRSAFLCGLAIEDVQYLIKFIRETAFYIEELERGIGEDLTDYWQTREHALHLLTELVIRMNEQAAKQEGAR